VLVPARTLPWTHTFGLGGSSLVLITLLAATGILNMLVYQPVPGVAYDSVVALQDQVPFGALVRGVHWWSANLLVVVLLLHVARVFLTGGYHGARQFNWVIGFGLLAAVLANNFTGYLLPWDQLAYWAVTISTAMLGYLPLIGGTLQQVRAEGRRSALRPWSASTPSTPRSSSGADCAHGLPLLAVRRAGGVVEPPAAPGGAEGDETKRLFLPDLLLREVVQALVIVAVVIVLAALFGAPLGERANPGMSTNPAKAPWYFMGFQELLIHLHRCSPCWCSRCSPVSASCCCPTSVRTTSRPAAGSVGDGRRTAALAAAAALVVTPILVIADELLAGDLPASSGAACCRSSWQWVQCGARSGSPDGATARATTRRCRRGVLLAVAFAVLTLIGVSFRGEGMALVWPWQP